MYCGLNGAHTTTAWATKGDTTMFAKIPVMVTVAAILGLNGSFMQGAVAQQRLIARGFDAAHTLPTVNVTFDAPVGHRQPSIAEIEQGQLTKGFRSPAEIDADEAYRKSHEILRNKLIICRC